MRKLTAIAVALGFLAATTLPTIAAPAVNNGVVKSDTLSAAKKKAKKKTDKKKMEKKTDKKSSLISNDLSAKKKAKKKSTKKQIEKKSDKKSSLISNDLSAKKKAKKVDCADPKNAKNKACAKTGKK